MCEWERGGARDGLPPVICFFTSVCVEKVEKKRDREGAEDEYNKWDRPLLTSALLHVYQAHHVSAWREKGHVDMENEGGQTGGWRNIGGGVTVSVWWRWGREWRRRQQKKKV